MIVGCRAIGLMVLMMVAGAAAISFRVEPSQKTVVLGQTTTLRCQVDNQDSIPVYWQNVVTGEYLSRDRKIDPFGRLSDSRRRRYRIVGDHGAGEYNLMIRRISMSDDSRYACVYFTETTYYSQVARIRVLKPPDKGFPSCLLGPKLQMEVGDNITLVCESKGGDPPATLTWIRGEQILKSAFIPHPSRTVAGFEHTLTEEDRNVRFTCVARNQALAQPRSCYVIPLRTQIEVILRPVVTTIYVGDSISFTCISENVPRLTYEWIVNGEAITESTSRYHLLRSGMRLRVVNATSEDDASIIICKVRQTQLGLGSQAMGQLWVRRLSDNIPEYTPTLLTTVPVTTTPVMTTTEVKLTTQPITTTEVVTTTVQETTLPTTMPMTTTTPPITTTSPPLTTTTTPMTTTTEPTTTSQITTTKPATTTKPVTTVGPVTTTEPVTTLGTVTTTEPVTTVGPVTTTKPALTTVKETTRSITTPKPPPTTPQLNVIGTNSPVSKDPATVSQVDNLIPGMPGTSEPDGEWNNNLSGLSEKSVTRPNPNAGATKDTTLTPTPLNPKLPIVVVGNSNLQRGDIPEEPPTAARPTPTTAKKTPGPTTPRLTTARPKTMPPITKPAATPEIPTKPPTTTIQATTVIATNSSDKPTVLGGVPPLTKTDEGSSAGVAAGLTVTFLLLIIVGVGLAVYFFKFRKPPPTK